MIVECESCGQSYEDVNHWTYCPHEYFPPPGMDAHTLAIQAKIEANLRPARN